MENRPLEFIPKYFTRSSILAYLLVLASCLIIFSSKRLPVMWIIFGLVEVICFFYFSNTLTRRWSILPNTVFVKKLFNTALVIRIAYAIFAFFFYRAMTGKPFEFQVADSEGYHLEALWIVDLIKHNALGSYFTYKWAEGVSDSGYPLWLSVIYLLTFNSIMVARLVNALLSAWTCVFIYKLARRNFGEEAGRIASTMVMLLPTLIYYSGLHLKETVLVFVLMAFVERADFLIRQRTFRTWNLLVVILLGAALFLFRTVLAVSAWFALFSALLLSSSRLIRFSHKTVYILWFVVAGLVLFSGTVFTEVEKYVKKRPSHQKTHMDYIATGKEANVFARYGKSSVFLPIILFAPFPTFVNIEDQEDKLMINGNVFTRNVYVFFVMIALYMLFKTRLLRENILILSCLMAYLAILALSGFALSERFHVPAVPFLVILAGYGITQINQRNSKYFIPYLVLMAIIIIGWNWFKLAGRGAL